MTIFELIFFIYVVSPVITTNVHKLIDIYNDKDKNKLIFDKIPEISEMISEMISIADNLNKREYELIDKLNFNSCLIVIVIVILLICILFYLYMKINDTKHILHGIKCAIITVVCLIMYQIFFYEYGLVFIYISSMEELIVLFVENIK